MRHRRSSITAVALVLVSFLTACASPEPLLRSNKNLQLYGRQAAKLEIDICRKNAEEAGLHPGGSQFKNTASGAVLGLTLGGAVGASAGVIGGLTGVTIGAAAGAGLGMVIGLLGGAFTPLIPEPSYAESVTRCLKEKGFEVSGWQ